MYTILNIVPYIVSDEYLCDLREALIRHSKTFFDRLPKYYLSPDGILKESKYYCQYLGLSRGIDTHYFMVDLNPVEPILQEEFSQEGIDLFKHISFLDLFKKLSDSEMFKIKNKLFSEKKLNTLKDLGIPISVNVIINLEYIGSMEDTDLKVSLIGYLDNSLNIVKL
jgi:hypothetical protein